MTVVEDLRSDMPLREISRVSGISLSSLHYREKERRVKRLSPQIEQDIIRTASERPHLRLQEGLGSAQKRRNCNQSEISQEGAEDQQSLPAIRKAQGKNKIQESVPSHGT